MFGNLQGQYPEDIQCVVEGTPGQGRVYLGNKEAAENLRTL